MFPLCWCHGNSTPFIVGMLDRGVLWGWIPWPSQMLLAYLDFRRLFLFIGSKLNWDFLTCANKSAGSLIEQEPTWSPHPQHQLLSNIFLIIQGKDFNHTSKIRSSKFFGMCKKYYMKMLKVPEVWIISKSAVFMVGHCMEGQTKLQ